ncbi:hypothetical protein A0J61_11587 [Choanephora cucurbitarum]|uniref:Uncharacterized protein n=1 Tax=Choanephora cucurbitarum TaxID=101091 RepID=A0A1C7MZ11_9FUNG|nr:hypothetical protein A0J61_11587 [Choanephora cucurbitarum]
MLVDPLFHLNTRVTGDRNSCHLPSQLDFPITFSAQLWHKDNACKSELHRACFNTTKKGYYAMFKVNQKRVKNNTYKVVWYVCKIVWFFEFLLDKSPNGVPSHFVLDEVFESCNRQSVSLIPEVKKAASTRKSLVEFDAGVLVCLVSLLEEVKSVENIRVVVSSILKWTNLQKSMYKFAGDVFTPFLAL